MAEEGGRLLVGAREGRHRRRQVMWKIVDSGRDEVTGGVKRSIKWIRFSLHSTKIDLPSTEENEKVSPVYRCVSVLKEM